MNIIDLIFKFDAQPYSTLFQPGSVFYLQQELYARLGSLPGEPGVHWMPMRKVNESIVDLIAPMNSRQQYLKFLITAISI